MSKFNVGDKVRVRKDINVGERYSGITLLSEMAIHRGKVFTIERFTGTAYLLLNNCYYYGEDMLERINSLTDEEKEKTRRISEALFDMLDF